LIAEFSTTAPGKISFGKDLGTTSLPMIDLAESHGTWTYFTTGGTIGAETMTYPTLETASDSGFNVTVSEEDGIWVVVDRVSGIFGSGETAAEGLEDFCHAVRDHLEMLETEEHLAEPLQRQLAYLRSRIN
jgi:hypothetical protein